MKKYLTPTTEVVKIQQQGIICTSATRQSYGSANSGVDDNELDSDGVWIWD